ncbi:MAG TPA: hypothetical protein VFO70_12500 [Chitinophagaceae bacterium]|nr:hypothetical protein [Chitinophagaceae bacterium]
MKKIVLYLFIPFLMRSAQVFAQPDPPAGNVFKEEQEKLLQNLRGLSSDTTIVFLISRHLRSETNSIYESLASDAGLPVLEKEKAIRSLVYFMGGLSKKLELHNYDLYDIPGALQSYKGILNALLRQKPLEPILVPLGPHRIQLLTSAFTQYKEYSLLDDIAVYKRMASTPEYILQFLENNSRFRFADSLLLEAAAHDPLKLVFYLNGNRPGVKEMIRNSRNIYLEKIVAISEDKNASELLPFVIQIAENKTTPEEIVETRKDVIKYFQLLVNTLQNSKDSKDSSSKFLEPLRDGIRQKSLSFFVNQINDLHNAADAIRFASVNGLRPEDIYYIITSSGDELYTSSYLGLYKRLMEHFKEQSADSLFDIVKFDNFRVFMRLAANYNVLPGFLSSMPRDSMEHLLRRFIAGIEDDTETGLEIAMDIADSFGSLGSATEIINLFQTELQSNLSRSKSGQQYLGMRLYGILLQVFELVRENGSLSKLWSTLGNYEMLKRAALENEAGKIIELVLFYGDEDGVASFNNFLKLYANNRKWSISKNENWISIGSLLDTSLSIYANKPLDMEEEMDLRAQDSLITFLQEQSLEPTILVHRGHSYHLDKTLKRLEPSVRLAILGSCGGYNKAISIASINPDVQVIGSKKSGTKSINDPILDEINMALINKRDLIWPELWKKLAARFSKDETALSLFNEYFPPSNNLSLFVLKLFISNKRVV